MAKKVIAVLLSFLFLIFIAAAVWLLIFGGLDVIRPIGSPLAPVVTLQEPVRGLYLSAADLPQEEPEAFLEEAVAFAEENGFNALYFEAREGQQLFWKDKSFPHSSCDAVHVLSGLCSQKGLALFIVADPYAAGADASLEGKLPGRYSITDGSFSSEDEAYRALTLKSFRRLAASDSVNGILLTRDPGGLLLPLLKEAGIPTGLFTDESCADAAVLFPAEGESAGEFLARSGDAVLDLAGCPAEEYAPALMQLSAGKGAITARYPLSLNSMDDRILTSAVQDGPLDFSLPVSHELSVGYPYGKIYTAQCFMMGSSDPALPLYMDGEEVERIGSEGTFGVLVDLAMGDNVFTFTQGDKELEYTVTRAVYTGKLKPAYRDGTKELKAGAVIEVESWICSVLSDPSDDGSIINTLPVGARDTVKRSKEVRRGRQRTMAYELESGGWVMAWNVKEAEAGEPVLTGPAFAADEKGETLTFSGGQPAALGMRDANSLTLFFYGAKNGGITLPEGSTLIRECRTNETEAGLELTLTFGNAQDFWGYQLTYGNEETKLYLKYTPKLSTRFAAPLEGITVMVDAGHGGEDTGALTPSGPYNEKEVNFTLAQAVSARLRQLGATVIETRTDDTKVSLEARNQLIAQEKPDFFLSVHHNSILLDRDVNPIKGLECYYFDEQLSKPFADSMLSHICAATGRESRGVHWNYFYVTRTTLAPAVLFEYGYLPNPAEFEDCFSRQGIAAAADGTAQAILAYLSER